MIPLLRLGAALPRLQLRYCGNRLVKLECIKKMPATVRSFKTKTSVVMEAQFKAKDLIPEGFQIVYRGGMDLYIHLAHNSSIIMTCIEIALCYRTFYIEDEVLEFPLYTSFDLIGIENYTQLFILHATFLLMMLCLQLISSRYVLRMYYNPITHTYKAIKLGLLPMTTRTQDVQARTLLRNTKVQILPWRNNVYKTNQSKIMIFNGGFRTGADFDRLFKD